MKAPEETTKAAEETATTPDADEAKRAKKKKRTLRRWTVTALRMVVGGVFIFSGWTKAVDPWGVLYKVTDYLNVFGVELSRESEIVFAIGLAAVEFALGMLMLTGMFRKTTAWLLSLFMAVMTPLTLWIWLADPVSDCGCFGEAWIISNEATFFKNVAICLLLVPLLMWNHRVKGLIAPKIQWLGAALSIAYPAILSIIGYNVQPLVDFRPYKTGSALGGDREAGMPTLVYEKEGTERSFSADSLPGDDWTYVRREDGTAGESGLSFTDANGDDMTEKVEELSHEKGGLLLLAVSDPGRHGISRSMMANRLSRRMEEDGGAFAAVVATDDSEGWRQSVGAQYEVYGADDTDIKELVRGDAGLVYVKDGIIKWKYNLYSLPPDAEMMEAPGSTTAIEDSRTLMKLTGTYLAAMILLTMFSATVRAVNKHIKFRVNNNAHVNKNS